MGHDTGEKTARKGKIFISNLPENTGWLIVERLFKDKVGGVTDVKIYKEAGGRPNGCAKVEFRNEDSA